MKRALDIATALVACIVLGPVAIVTAIVVKLTSKGPILYWSDRIGQRNEIFRMPKFRTMRTDTPQVATHLLSDSKSWLTPPGRLLRSTSLDELPQLWSVLVGDMSLVGPRPALFNQDDLVGLRTERGVHELVPGVTGWAQINGRDDIEIPAKVELDEHYLRNQNTMFDIKILFMTLGKVLRRDGVSQADDEPAATPSNAVATLRWGGFKRFLMAAPIYITAFAACWMAAYLLRFEFVLNEKFLEQALLLLPAAIAVKLVTCTLAREWSRSYRYTSLSDLVFTAYGVAAGGFVFFILNEVRLFPLVAPRSVIIIDALLALLATTAIRSTVRVVLMAARRPRRPRTNAIIYGSTDAGVNILRAVQSAQSEYRVVGFIDSDGTSTRSIIGGIPVVRLTEDLGTVARRLNADRLLLPATMPGRKVREVVDACRDHNLSAHVIPAVEEIVEGRFQVSPREVTISDLLRREPAQLDMDSIRDYVVGRNVLVTGAAGSIGSELCRQLEQLNPSSLAFVDQSEFGIFTQQQIMKQRPRTSTEISYYVRDVTDREALSRVMDEVRPDIIFHAAAYKHVPLMEANPGEAIRNNVFGTKVVVDLAAEKGIERCVLISTDKAVQPTSVMGRTKLVGEKYLQVVAAKSKTRFITVRFGNVLDSMGSVVPTFRKQIERGGPVTVTHPDMERFFMTIPEAVQLVLQAGAIGDSGDILILDMGEPVRIFDLAQDMISLSGLSYPDDIDIEFTGVRPGEKLYEELFYKSEKSVGKVHEQIFCAPRQRVNRAEVMLSLRQLEDVCRPESEHDAAAVLNEVVLGLIRENRENTDTIRRAA